MKFSRCNINKFQMTLLSTIISGNYLFKSCIDLSFNSRVTVSFFLLQITFEFELKDNPWIFLVLKLRIFESRVISSIKYIMA